MKGSWHAEIADSYFSRESSNTLLGYTRHVLYPAMQFCIQQYMSVPCNGQSTRPTGVQAFGWIC